MVEGQRGFWSALIVGSMLWIGCSDEPATPTAGSGDSGSAVTDPISDAPESLTPPIGEAPAASSPEPSPAELIEAGRVSYNANCIACHSLDPAKDGALGPAIAGASLEVLEARVLRAEYPVGYTPKRNTRVMVALPHLEPRLKELDAYLNSLE